MLQCWKAGIYHKQGAMLLPGCGQPGRYIRSCGGCQVGLPGLPCPLGAVQRGGMDRKGKGREAPIEIQAAQTDLPMQMTNLIHDPLTLWTWWVGSQHQGAARQVIQRIWERREKREKRQSNQHLFSQSCVQHVRPDSRWQHNYTGTESDNTGTAGSINRFMHLLSPRACGLFHWEQPWLLMKSDGQRRLRGFENM